MRHRAAPGTGADVFASERGPGGAIVTERGRQARSRTVLVCLRRNVRNIAGRPIIIYGDGTAVRDYGYIDDVASGPPIESTSPRRVGNRR
jgi:hypothetical protein